MGMDARLTRIFRFPVKGLSAQELPAVDLAPEQALPLDRRFAVRPGAAPADLSSGWRPRCDFLTPERCPRLAALDTDLEGDDRTLVVRRHGRVVARGRLDTPTGRMVLEQFLAAYLKGEAPGMPRIVEAGAEAFLDWPDPRVVILNAASVAELNRRLSVSVDPRSLRANLIIEGLPPWAEQGWPGQTLAIGPARLEVVAPAGLSPAVTGGEGEPNIPQVFARAYGRSSMGVLARVVTGGRIVTGEAVRVV